MTAQQEPHHTCEDPAALAWTAQMFREARRRRLARVAAEAQARDPQCSKVSATVKGDARG